MNGGLLVGCAGNRVMCVPAPKFRAYVTCKSQIDWLVYGAEGKRVVYLPTDVILWLAWAFYTSALSRAHKHTRVWAQTDVAADLRRGPYEPNFLPKTTRNNSKICMLTYTDRKEINKKQTRRSLSGEMRGRCQRGQAAGIEHICSSGEALNHVWCHEAWTMVRVRPCTLSPSSHTHFFSRTNVRWELNEVFQGCFI